MTQLAPNFTEQSLVSLGKGISHSPLQIPEGFSPPKEVSVSYNLYVKEVWQTQALPVGQAGLLLGAGASTGPRHLDGEVGLSGGTSLAMLRRPWK